MPYFCAFFWDSGLFPLFKIRAAFPVRINLKKLLTIQMQDDKIKFASDPEMSIKGLDAVMASRYGLTGQQ